MWVICHRELHNRGNFGIIYPLNKIYLRHKTFTGRRFEDIVKLCIKKIESDTTTETLA